MISLYISSEDGITPKIFSFKLKQNFHLEPIFIIVYNHGEFITYYRISLFTQFHGPNNNGVSGSQNLNIGLHRVYLKVICPLS